MCIQYAAAVPAVVFGLKKQKNNFVEFRKVNGLDIGSLEDVLTQVNGPKDGLCLCLFKLTDTESTCKIAVRLGGEALIGC